ncbi:uncharacterized protein A4U43_C01F22260 [Asparagus officinalis]|uniref:tRNA (adenine(58)-N(1))-methyltransferase non-catalytic subunit TRM6 n=1 Tax=Asparagus officinalis TaxID=4686 RepID=A0A5P1FRW1_ASPOF|nr:uncharacterized protein A4U43_C01F22260 [Asparagus officinalis]
MVQENEATQGKRTAWLLFRTTPASFQQATQGPGHVCSNYFGTKPPSLDIVRIFNFSNEVCRSLIVAAPEMDVESIIEDLLPILSYYAPFAIYHQYLQVCYVNLKLGTTIYFCYSIYTLMGKIHKSLNIPAKDMFYFGIALDLKPPAADVAAIKVQQGLNWLGQMLGLLDNLLESRLSK